MTRLYDTHSIVSRWLVFGTLVFAIASATALPVAAQSSGAGSSEAMTADPAATDAAITDTEQTQAADAAPAVAPAPKPTVAPVQFGPTGC